MATRKVQAGARLQDGPLVRQRLRNGTPREIARQLARYLDVAPGRVAAWCGKGKCQECGGETFRLITVTDTAAALMDACRECGAVGKWVLDRRRIDDNVWPWTVAAWEVYRWD